VVLVHCTWIVEVAGTFAVRTPAVPKSSVEALLMTQVAASVIVAVKVVVVVVAEEGPTNCRRQAAVRAPVTLNRERSFDMADMKSLPTMTPIK
jgi:hypothetical protein